MENIFQRIEKAKSFDELLKVAREYFKANPLTQGANPDVIKALTNKELSLKVPATAAEEQAMYKAINDCKELKEFDKLVIKIFMGPLGYSNNFLQFISQKEAEMTAEFFRNNPEFNILDPYFKAAPKPNHLSVVKDTDILPIHVEEEFEQKTEEELEEVALEDIENKKIVAYDPSKRKTKEEDPYKIVRSKKDTSSIKCGCPDTYGLPCLHKTSFEGITPDNYQECSECGCDHKLDPRMANEVHAKINKK